MSSTLVYVTRACDTTRLLAALLFSSARSNARQGQETMLEYDEGEDDLPTLSRPVIRAAGASGTGRLARCLFKRTP